MSMLVFCVLAPVPAPAAAAEEAQLLSLVNALRSSRGLRPLVVNAELRAVANDWAERMAAAQDISHSPLETRVSAGWARLGENVAVDFTVGAAERALEASPGHLANLVSPSFTYVGIGVAHGADGGIYVVQDFMQLAGVPPPDAAPAPRKPRPATPPKPRPASARRAQAPSPPPPPPPPPPAAEPSARLSDVFARLRGLDAGLT